MSTLESYLSKISDLNLVPPVLLSILTLSDDNELPFSDLEKIVQSDQILVSRLLHLANSPFYQRGDNVENINQVITRLGFRTVRSMIALAFMDSLFSAGNYKKFRSEIWEHSIASAVIAQFLCEDYSMKKEKDLALLGGLLKELGKVSLNAIDRNKYIEVLTEYLNSDFDLLDIEKKIFGVDSQEMGVAATKLWNLPESITEIIRDFGNEILDQSMPVRVVTFSSLIARQAGYGKFDEHHRTRCENYREMFGIPSEKMEAIVEVYGKRLRENDLFRFCFTL